MGHEQCRSMSLGRRFSIISRNIQQIIRGILKDVHIGSGQFMFIHAVSRNEGISQQELSVLLDVDKATCARAVMKLYRRGYIRREQDSGDLRLHHLYLTEKGHHVMPHIKETMRRVTEICGSELTPVEREELVRLLDKVVDSTGAWIQRMKEER